MQHGVLGAADVQIDGHPGFFDRRIDRRAVVLRIEEAQIVPARTGPLRHGVGFALIAFAVDHRVEPLGGRFIERRLGSAVRLEVFEVRQVDRQIFFVDCADAAGGFTVGIELVQNRERFAPEALAREEPVAEFVVDGFAAEALRGEIGM